MTQSSKAPSRGQAAPLSPTLVDRASDVAKNAAAGIEANPVVAVAGGIALGVIAGALLPRSDQEAQLLSPIGERIGGATRAAIAAAKTAGQDAIAESGLSRDAVREKAGNLVGQALKAAGAAGSAALQAARDTKR